MHAYYIMSVPLIECICFADKKQDLQEIISNLLTDPAEYQFSTPVD